MKQAEKAYLDRVAQLPCVLCGAYALRSHQEGQDYRGFEHMTDKQRIEILRGYIELDATCPCCEELETCKPGCSLETDAFYRHDEMITARAVLKDTA